MEKPGTSPCNLCPRECGADRDAGEKGYCQSDSRIYVARAALHRWEEPCISGKGGSGTVFFSGCNLRCVYCQNHEIASGGAGKPVTVERLAEIFLELQDKGAENINLVTPDHHVAAVAKAVLQAKERGLFLPVVYNGSGYEKPEAIRKLSGIVDVFLTDFKYMDASLAERFSHAKDYPETAKRALAEMVDITSVRPSEKGTSGEGVYITRNRLSMKDSLGRVVDINRNSLQDYDSLQSEVNINQEIASSSLCFDENGMLRRGVIVRHLLLPGHKRNAKDVIRYVHETYGDSVILSIMNQYTPVSGIAERTDCEELYRKVTRREYAAVVEYAVELGVKNAYIQEGDTAKESFVPDFNGEGV